MDENKKEDGKIVINNIEKGKPHQIRKKNYIYKLGIAMILTIKLCNI